MREVAVAGLFAVSIVWACGSTPAAGGGGTATNTCSGSCAAYGPISPQPTCVNGMCRVDAAPEYAVVVATPTTGAASSGRSFGLSLKNLAAGGALGNCPVGSLCSRLPGLIALEGSYVVTPTLAMALGRDLETTAATVQIPVHATYRPLTGSSTTVSYADLSGLPIESVMSDVVTVGPTGAVGPVGAPPRGFSISLPPGRYERTLTPDAPFDDTFPPKVDVVTVDRREFDVLDLASHVIAAFPFTIRSDRYSLAGWTAALVDGTTGAPLSSTARLTRGVNPITLRLIDHLSQAGAPTLEGLALVIAPPRGEALPTLAVDAVAETIPSDETVPAFPDPPLVRGRIVVCGSTPLPGAVVSAGPPCSLPSGTGRATLVLQSLTIVSPTQNLPGLHYATHVRSAEDGTFAVRLPAGEYEVDVIPDADATFAATTRVGLLVASGVAEQFGKSIAVTSPRTVRGVAKLTDGRLVAGAVVEAWPRRGADDATGHADALRARRSATAADGSFAIDVDPGVYDVAIEPAPETGFPWAVVPNVDATRPQAPRGDAGAGGVPATATPTDVPVDLGTVAVPLPVRADFTLRDAGNNPAAHALVRAFAIPKAPAGQPPRTTYVPIGAARTDPVGRYVMWIAPSFASAEAADSGLRVPAGPGH